MVKDCFDIVENNLEDLDLKVDNILDISLGPTSSEDNQQQDTQRLEVAVPHNKHSIVFQVHITN